MLFFGITALTANLLTAAKVATTIGTAMVAISPAVEKLRDEFDI